jgi:hypothetical protein
VILVPNLFIYSKSKIFFSIKYCSCIKKKLALLFQNYFKMKNKINEDACFLSL